MPRTLGEGPNDKPPCLVQMRWLCQFPRQAKGISSFSGVKRRSPPEGYRDGRGGLRLAFDGRGNPSALSLHLLLAPCRGGD